MDKKRSELKCLDLCTYLHVQMLDVLCVLFGPC